MPDTEQEGPAYLQPNTPHFRGLKGQICAAEEEGEVDESEEENSGEDFSSPSFPRKHSFNSHFPTFAYPGVGQQSIQKNNLL